MFVLLLLQSEETLQTELSEGGRTGLASVSSRFPLTFRREGNKWPNITYLPTAFDFLEPLF